MYSAEQNGVNYSLSHAARSNSYNEENTQKNKSQVEHDFFSFLYLEITACRCHLK